MDVVRITGTVAVPLDELTFRFSRSGGPGGQNVNRRETRVELVWDLESSPSLTEAQRTRVRGALESRLDSRGRLRIVASEERTQAQNRDRAIGRFRELVAEALKVRRSRRPTTPGPAARERRLTEKRVRSRVKRERTRPDVD